MALNDWDRYLTPDCNMVLIVKEGEPYNCLDTRGDRGDMYLLPRRDYNLRGHSAGCFRVLFTKHIFPASSEVRIYTMLSQEDITREGSCYAVALDGNQQVILYKYLEGGLSSTPQVLCSLRLPGDYKKGVFGLMWVHDPAVREGVFFRGLLCLDPKNPQNAYRLFDYVDTDSPLVTTCGEGFGLSISQKNYTQVFFEKTALHQLHYKDPKEVINNE